MVFMASSDRKPDIQEIESWYKTGADESYRK